MMPIMRFSISKSLFLPMHEFAAAAYEMHFRRRGILSSTKSMDAKSSARPLMASAAAFFDI